MADTEAGALPASAVEATSVDEFAALLEKDFAPKSGEMRTEAHKAVQTLAEMALKKANLVPEEAVNQIKEMIEEIDKKLTDQINEVLHHADFQKMEGAWRGLAHLLGRSETGADLKIKVMPISKKELRKELARTADSEFDQNPLFKKIYEQGYGVLGGDPYAAIVADFHFDHGAADVKILQGMARIAASAHAPFIAGASHTLFNLDDWQGLPDRKDLANIMTTAPYASWRALRESEDSRYLGLAMPRFLARTPYGADNPVDEFDFKEQIDGADASKFCWANSAYAMAANITRAFKTYGWCSRIRGVESGGAVENLSTYTFPTDKGGYASQCPTEVSITDRREMELANAGLMPLVYKQNSNMAAFIGAQSVHQPAVYDNPDASKNAQLGARLPYIFACARFAHYLKHMVRNKVGSYMERDDMERWLGGWINNYVQSSATASEIQKAQKPLAAAEVEVVSDPENPGMYSAKFFLRPHYQLEGTNVSLRLVSKLPSQAGG